MSIDIDQAIPRVAAKVKDLHVPIVDLVQAQTREPWKVLVATILSARTNDQVTSQVVRRLFKRIERFEQLADTSLATLEKLIYPVGFYRNKAKYLQRLPGAVQEQFGGTLPDDVDALTRLPGVGRKTANLVVAVAFNKPAICVDTHVHRIMNIWEVVDTTTPLETEMALRATLPQKYWIPLNSILVAYGQAVCRPVAPHCDDCVVSDLCPRKGVRPRKVRRSRNADEPLLLMSWNVNGIRAAAKKGFLDVVRQWSPDVLGIQETKARPEQLDPEIREIPGYQSYWFSAQRKGYAGVAVYTKISPLEVIEGIGVDTFDDEGRVLTLEFDDFYFVNAYFPNAQDGLARIDYKVAFNAAILDFCERLRPHKTVVLCGDYNVAHQPIDLARPKENEGNAGYSQPERQAMDRFLAAGYVDTFRMFNQEPGHYTWWTYRSQARQRDIGWRIDYFCVDQESRHRVLEAGICKEVMGSDHCPITLTLARGPRAGSGRNKKSR